MIFFSRRARKSAEGMVDWMIASPVKRDSVYRDISRGIRLGIDTSLRSVFKDSSISLRSMFKKNTTI